MARKSPPSPEKGEGREHQRYPAAAFVSRRGVCDPTIRQIFSVAAIGERPVILHHRLRYLSVPGVTATPDTPAAGWSSTACAPQAIIANSNLSRLLHLFNKFCAVPKPLSELALPFAFCFPVLLGNLGST